MGSHHQFQDIQGLASQQPASADMVLLGFGGVASLGGLRSLFYHVMARAGPRNVGTRAILGLFADGFAYFPKRRRRRERAAAGARVLYCLSILASDFCMLALLQRLGEALRGAGVPTPHAALRHADVTLSPRRPRSCGQR